jgi:hypothetical protein
MSKKLRFYSNEENEFITMYAQSGKPVNEKNLEEFCKKNKRSFLSVSVKVYELRKKLGLSKNIVKNVSPKANLVKDKTVVNLSKGEFKIPISNWNVKNENGQFYFVVQF